MSDILNVASLKMPYVAIIFSGHVIMSSTLKNNEYFKNIDPLTFNKIFMPTRPPSPDDAFPCLMCGVRLKAKWKVLDMAKDVKYKWALDT